MPAPIYDGFSGRQLKLGDKLRSIERGDIVQVVELGEGMDGEPTIRLEPFSRSSPVLPYKGSTFRPDEGGDERRVLYMYTLA